MARIVVVIKDATAESDGTWVTIKVSCEAPIKNFQTSILLDFDKTPALLKVDALNQVKAALKENGYTFVTGDKLLVLGGIT